MRLGDIDELPADRPLVVTLGVFDGIHTGHAHVLRTLTSAAAEADAVPVVITFDPHPEQVVLGRSPRLLCSLDERVARLEAAGVGIVVVQRFDEAFRQQSAAAFLDRLRLGRQLRGLVMSPESAFGHDRQGTIELVRRLAAEEGWRLIEIPLLELDGERVSSARIRSLLAEGRRDEAARLLGRPVDDAMAAGPWAPAS
ncbi:MAG: FAD synthetase family protein [Chloroflexota bacterium]